MLKFGADELGLDLLDVKLTWMTDANRTARVPEKHRQAQDDIIPAPKTSERA